MGKAKAGGFQWPWGRSWHVDVLFRSGKTITFLSWKVSCTQTGGNDLTGVTVSLVDPADSWTYMRLESIDGIFHRKGRMRWRGWFG